MTGNSDAQQHSPRTRFEDPAFRKRALYHFISRHAYMAVPLIDRNLLYDPIATSKAIEEHLTAMSHAVHGEASDQDRQSILKMFPLDPLLDKSVPERFRWLTSEQSRFLTETAYVIRVLKHLSPRFQEFVVLSALVEEELSDLAEKLLILSPYRNSAQFKERPHEKNLSPWKRVRAYLNDRLNRRNAELLYGKIYKMRQSSLLGEALYLNKLDDEFRNEYHRELTELMGLYDTALKRGMRCNLPEYFERKLRDGDELWAIYEEAITLDKLHD